MEDTAALVDYKIPAKELKKRAESQIYSNLDCKQNQVVIYIKFCFCS